MAASDLVRSGSPIFIDQRPEPLLAPDLTTMDLRSRYLDPAFAGTSPGRSDRLTASLNLQIRVAPVHETGTASACRPTLGQRITISTNRQTTPRFVVSAEAAVAFTLREGGSRSALRVIDLPKGIYTISSIRDAGDLMIESTSPASLLADC